MTVSPFEATSSIEEPWPNLPLLRKVLDHIDAHPEEWHQRFWAINTTETACGTAYCIAGHAAVMTGHDVKIDPADIWSVLVDDNESCIRDLPDEPLESTVAFVARQELGLSFEDGCVLFASWNDRATVQAIAEDIAARAGERL